MSADDVLPDDGELLERLAVALRVEPAPPLEPSADELAFLAAAVANRHTDRRVASGLGSAGAPSQAVVVRFARRRVQRYGSRLIAVVGAATILGGATAAAAASGKIDALRPVRQAEYDLGVPGVESPRLSDIRQTLDTLASAKENHDSATQSAASAKLAVQYHRLDSAEQHDVMPIVQAQVAADPALVEALPAILEPPTTVAPPESDSVPPETAPTDTTPPETAPPETTPPDTTPPETTPPDTTPPQPAATDAVVPTTSGMSTAS